MKNLNETQREILKTFTNVEVQKSLIKALKKVNNEIKGLTEDQVYSLNNNVYTDSARKKLVRIFREENLFFNLNKSIN